MIERQTEKKVKILRTENGMEFYSKKFKNAHNQEYLRLYESKC